MRGSEAAAIGVPDEVKGEEDKKMQVKMIVILAAPEKAAVAPKGKKKFLCMRGAFHGKTHGALSLTTATGTLFTSSCASIARPASMGT